ncbi:MULTISPECIES: TerC/Alx family metal homeostasis membrane protein [Myroides]|uniref:TerC/Alx family metal homeostasis membrane protein n=1 Tax=Myroides albus TaxID=2562892 RepID=A0A6I3LFA8_9FLAO|nr:MULTISPECIES: TerC/Alx family metal homeostasis membrane protein [Myroides]MTG96587.1 TerC/Alx family metal homeostasis membrane protein [Myroides albus]MVX34583.1 TerC/Alx family metal homeostasis membrane protein [Myroides sp. LoEW2-1]UVD81000.1 TerC/Alx family metal homeostasis membrane protein [Myroides albus]
MDHLINHPGLLAGFGIVVLVMLLLDLGVFNRHSHTVSTKEALIWTVVWIGLAMCFSGVIYYYMDFENFARFQSAYWIEKALSVDNLFVFILVFTFFKVPKELHHRVLFWGIIGALVFRAIFIFAGVEIINHTYLPEMELFGRNVEINIVLTIFGIFLLISGIKSWFAKDDHSDEQDLSKNFAVRMVHKFFKVSNEYDGEKFFTVKNGVKMVTPLFVALMVIEFTDVIFAVDSIPAIFAIAPDDPFILYTSNIFAILGLRSLYFLLANFMDRFSKLKYGLAIILSFIGIKMIISPFYHVDSMISLSVIGGVLILSVVASFLFPPKKDAL